MTKVTLHYELIRHLTDEDLPNIANVHSTYGIERVQVAPALDRITVDYDASRLKKADLEAALARHGLPIRTAAQAVA
jgi:copper chaperone CopZ